MLPGLRPSPWPMLALLRVLIRVAQLTAAQPFFFPRIVGSASLRCLTMLGVGVQAALRVLGASGSCVCSVVMWVWVCTYLYITEVSVRNALW